MIVSNLRTNRCSEYFRELILNDLENYQVWVAGGAIRSWFSNERRSDIDLFFSDESERHKACSFLQGKGAEVTYENDNVTKLKYNGLIFDFCRHYFSGPEETIAEFDFTVSMAAVSREGFYCHENFFMDLASKRLAFNRIPYPLSSLHRFQKYVRKGYWMCKEEMVKLSKAIAGVDFERDVSEQEIDEEFLMSGGGNPFPGMD